MVKNYGILPSVQLLETTAVKLDSTPGVSEIDLNKLATEDDASDDHFMQFWL